MVACGAGEGGWGWGRRVAGVEITPVTSTSILT